MTTFRKFDDTPVCVFCHIVCQVKSHTFIGQIIYTVVIVPFTTYSLLVIDVHYQ